VVDSLPVCVVGAGRICDRHPVVLDRTFSVRSAAVWRCNASPRSKLGAANFAVPRTSARQIRVGAYGNPSHHVVPFGAWRILLNTWYRSCMLVTWVSSNYSLKRTAVYQRLCCHAKRQGRFRRTFFAQQKTLRPEDLRVRKKPLAVTYSHMA